MKKLIPLLLMMFVCATANAQTWYSWRYRTHATDCTSLTGGKARDLCFEADSNDMYKCVPIAGDCDSSSEWQRVGNYTNVELTVVEYTTDIATGNGKAYFYVPDKLDGMVLYAVHGQVITAGTTSTTDIQLARCAAATSGNICSGTVNDMLSTKLTIDSGENSSTTAATAAVIDTDYDDMTTGQVIRVDIDAVSTTEPRGLILTLTFVKASS